jgi:hypothetical protein
MYRVALIGSFITLHNALRSASRGRQRASLPQNIEGGKPPGAL